jgi:hypothetical protein
MLSKLVPMIFTPFSTRLFGQFEGGLATQLYNHAFGLLQFNNFPEVLPKHGLEVQFIGNIEIGRNGFGVTVHHNGFITTLFNGHEAMYATVIELNALTNAVGAAA